MLVYQALDYGLSEGEEHKLSPALERLIEDMTVSNEAAQDKDTSSDMDGDEGIENDSDEEEDTAAVVHVTFDDVIQVRGILLRRLSPPNIFVVLQIYSKI